MLRIATRGSALARAQTGRVAAALERDGVRVETSVLETKGDAVLDRPFRAIEGKGFFTKELEDALLAREADAAVHSMKDLPTDLPVGLVVGAVTERADAADCLLVRRESHDSRYALPVAPGGRVGTTSARRRAQWIARRPDTTLADLRGNVPTRVEKLRRGEYDAIVLAASGLERLGLDLSAFSVIRLDPSVFVCAPAQGALAVEVRREDARAEWIARLDRPDVREAVDAERLVLSGMGGGCSEPVGAFARRRAGAFAIDAVIGPETEGAGRLRRAHVVAASYAAAVDTAVAALRSPASEVPFDLEGRTVAITAQRALADRLARELEERGARVWLAPLIETARDVPAESERALAEIGAFDAVLVASRTAAEALLQLLPHSRIDAMRNAAAPLLGAVGAASAEPLEDAGLRVAIIGDGSGGADLAARTADALRGRRARILIPGAREPHGALAARLEREGHEVVRAPIYVTRAADPHSLGRLHGERVDAAVFASPSAALAFSTHAPFKTRVAVAIGATTHAALAGAGIPSRLAPSPDPASIAETIR